LAAARDATGLAVVTEVMTPHHVDMVCRYADVLQIGARNMQNYHLLQAVGETRKPVLHNGALECRFFRFELVGGRYRPRAAEAPS
jgi:3-deoxy-D-arabino-heptulosonate 7-phosphate (DAHP) synthase